MKIESGKKMQSPRHSAMCYWNFLRLQLGRSLQCQHFAMNTLGSCSISRRRLAGDESTEDLTGLFTTNRSLIKCHERPLVAVGLDKSDLPLSGASSGDLIARPYESVLSVATSSRKTG